MHVQSRCFSQEIALATIWSHSLENHPEDILNFFLPWNAKKDKQKTKTYPDMRYNS